MARPVRGGAALSPGCVTRVFLLTLWALGAALAQDEERQGAPEVEVSRATFPENTAARLPELGGLLPVILELRSTTGRTENVTLELQVLSGRLVTFSFTAPVEVAPGAPRRHELLARVGSTQDDVVELTVRGAGQKVLRRQQWRVNALAGSQSRFSLLVVGTDIGDVVPWGTGIERVLPELENQEISVDLADPRSLPENALGYQAFSLVLLRGLEGEQLEPGQIDALRAWACQGGAVVLAPRGRSPAVFRTSLAAALFGSQLTVPTPRDGFIPHTLHLTDSREHRGSRQIAGGKQQVQLSGSLAYTVIDPIPARLEREIFSFDGKGAPGAPQNLPTRIYAEQPFGLGRAGFFTLDEQAHRDVDASGLINALWAHIIQDRSKHTSSFLRQATSLLLPQAVEALRDPSRSFGVGFLLVLLVAYLLLVGPILYFVLRRLGRLTAVIWVQPLVALLYVGAIFASAYLSKGVLNRTRTYTFLSQQRGQPDAVRTSYLSIFSGAELTYSITVDRAMLLRPLYKNEEEIRPLRLSRAPRGDLTLSGQHLAHWEEGSFSSTQLVPLKGPGVELEIEAAPDPAAPAGPQLKVKIVNHLEHAITGGFVVLGSVSRRFEERIEPGASASIDRLVLDDGASPVRRTIARFLSGWDIKPQLIAVLDRKVEDFRLDQPTTLKERLDLFLLWD